jgi:hypothetical protein
MSIDGPATLVAEDELLEPLLVPEVGASELAEAFALRLVTQTSDGIKIASSRNTRCQSKRL